MEVLYSDNDIVVIIKPVGILSQADSNGGESVVSILSGLYGGEIYPLHRLDKQVGGVMVYAKNKAFTGNCRASFNKGIFSGCPRQAGG